MGDDASAVVTEIEADPGDLAAAAEPWAHARADCWAPVRPELDRAIATDRRLAAAARQARRNLLRDASRRLDGDYRPEGERLGQGRGDRRELGERDARDDLLHSITWPGGGAAVSGRLRASIGPPARGVLPMDFAAILRLLGRSEGEVAALFRTGSRVYGTASPASDEDFVAVLARRDARRDLAFGAGVNVVIHGLDTFRDALADHSVFALECLFVAPEHRLKDPRPPFAFTLDRKKLLASAGGRSASDFAKAGKCFAEEPGASKKKLFHALRVPMFALQIARKGRITDYGEASGLWRELAARADGEWEPYLAAYGPVREQLVRDLEASARRR